LLVLWREWRLDRLLAREWRQGKVFAGFSPGSLCWFESGVSDSFGPRLAPVHALGWIRGSHFFGRKLHRVVSSRPNAKAYRVARTGRTVTERPLETEFLGARRRARRRD
jgi:peptidase E